MWIVKTDGDGNETWARILGSGHLQIGVTATQMADGNYMIASRSSDPFLKNSPANRTMLTRLKPNGDLINRDDITFGYPGWTIPISAALAPDGNLIMTLESISDTLERSMLVKNIANINTPGWYFYNEHTGFLYTHEQAITILPNEHQFTAGYARLGGNDAIYFRESADMKVQRWKCFKSSGNERCLSTAYDSNGKFLMAGSTTSSGAGKEDVLFLKVGPDFNVEIARAFGSAGTDVGNAMVVSSSGQYAITGYTDGYGNGKQVFLLCLDGQGNNGCTGSDLVLTESLPEKEKDNRFTYSTQNIEYETRIPPLFEYTSTQTQTPQPTDSLSCRQPGCSFDINANITHISCNDSSNGAILLTHSSNATVDYLWSDGNTTGTRTGLIPGIYTVTATENQTGCTVIHSYNLNPATYGYIQGTILASNMQPSEYAKVKLLTWNPLDSSETVIDSTYATSTGWYHFWVEDIQPTYYIKAKPYKGSSLPKDSITYYETSLTIQGAKPIVFTCDSLDISFSTFSTLPNGINESAGHQPIFILYPNPFSNTLHIVFTDRDRMEEVRLFTIDGKQVYEEDGVGASTHDLNTGALPAGIYILEATLQSGDVVRSRVIK
ncbi:MAG: T9SS type A sorting domain-containing protein [Chitinophagales bacterium]|nr:T9SS type A sorting domain-containing protein [Chitinophagales bacterium]